MTLRSRLEASTPSLASIAVATTALTFVLMLLGIWTAVGGYGLTCNGRWPICDGAVFGLFPANFGSFVEWFHRLVAMITGFAIMGTAIAAWRGGAERRVRAAFLLALVITPLQIVLGALTVTTYERLILALHFGSALTILALLVAGTAWTVEDIPSIDRLAAIAALALPPALLLTPGVFVDFLLELHLLYNALGLGAFVALFLASLGARTHSELPRLAAGVGAVATALALIVGRVRLDATGQATILLGLGIALAMALATILLSRRAAGIEGSIGSTHS
ncbi:cytochrome-c-aa3 oxidase assembly factor CtaA [Salinarchaeum sp. Harcht-Bsk1]|uniref:COX15/CtaA family protein n=1 Tax=Salinarchaeum sp. Harcht-Bsk1 TaxID=1333523 RepID=UPI000342384A|nr:COX15/CtaA family protein [Salinarchaeum sp. Harcht-Bsk1]AGN01541.1 cytochrome-c-aa3 oxidase assembly factor CtaA [Salinarchaeum sp. Harcht-Bsk1]